MKPEKLTCELALDRLQRRLDGEFAPSDSSLTAHLRQCAQCRLRFAAADKLLRAYPPRLPAGFSATVIRAARAETRLRVMRRTLISAFSIAAALVLAIWLAWPVNTKPDEIPLAKVPSLETQLADATGAVREWTNRATRTLPELPSVPSVDLGATMEPATTALADTGRGFADSVQPLTSSFQRAANRFWQDLPGN